MKNVCIFPFPHFLLLCRLTVLALNLNTTIGNYLCNYTVHLKHEMYKNVYKCTISEKYDLPFEHWVLIIPYTDIIKLKTIALVDISIFI